MLINKKCGVDKKMKKCSDVFYNFTAYFFELLIFTKIFHYEEKTIIFVAYAYDNKLKRVCTKPSDRHHRYRNE